MGPTLDGLIAMLTLSTRWRQSTFYTGLVPADLVFDSASVPILIYVTHQIVQNYGKIGKIISNTVSFRPR